MAAEKEQTIAEEYLSSLMDLNVNSKPLINMLTMLAEDYIEHVHVIVRVVEQHLAKVQPECKLPIMYLVDSIVKNVGEKYKFEFSKCIVNMFCGVFEKVNEKVREKLFNLRQTWKDVFPTAKLYALDVKVNAIDRNWPITAEIGQPKVHVNPNFFHRPTPPSNETKNDILEQMRAKERELLELKKMQIEMELRATKKKLEEADTIPTPMIPPRPTVPLPANPMADMPPFQPHHHHGRQTRIAAVNSSMIRSARTARDPRLARELPPPAVNHHQVIPQSIIGTSTTKSLPKIPKLSQSKSRESERDRASADRDPRLRKDDSKSSSKSDKSSSSRGKSSSSRSSSSRSSDRKKSSDRKRDDDKKSSSSHKSSSHRSGSHSSSRSPRSKSPRLPSEIKDLDMRQPVKPDSTTGVNKLLDELLNGEENLPRSSTSNENGKQSKPILVDTYCDKEQSDIEWEMANYVLVELEALPRIVLTVSY